MSMYVLLHVNLVNNSDSVFVFFQQEFLAKMALHAKVLCSFTIILLMCIQSVTAMDGCVYPKTPTNDRNGDTGKPWDWGWRCGDTCL